MAVSYLLGFTPKWVVLDNLGVPAAGGKLYTFDNINRSLLRASYESPSSSDPWTNPIIFDANGTQGPIYFKSDSAVPGDGYYLRMYDANNNLLWDQENFTGAGGSGGGGVITNDVTNINLVSNGVFWRTNQPLDATFATSTKVILAPGAHDSFVDGANTHGSTGPDIIFAKNNTAATDTLKFVSFTADDLPGSEITPQYYLEYACTGLGAGETYKYVQFPITPKVRNLSNTSVSGVIYARCTAGNPTLQLYIRQFYGDGASATAEIFPFTPFGATITLTNGWARYEVSGTVPNVDAVTIGECHNDALFLCVGLPLSAVSTIDFIKPQMYTGDFHPNTFFETMDQVDAVTMAPRVGDIKTSLASVAPPGYLAMNDGSIGSLTSGATTRANVDTFALYSLLWNSVSNTYAPVSTGRGANAYSDFAANKTLTIPLSLGRALGGAGLGFGLTSRALGESVGAETISIAAMPAHNHPGSVDAYTNTVNATGGGGSTRPVLSGPGTAVTVASQGGSAADGNMSPTSFFNVFIKY